MGADNDFKKLQVRVSLKKTKPEGKILNEISLEIGYPDSTGNFIWKNSGRIFVRQSKSFLKGQLRNGAATDAVFPCSFRDFTDFDKDFVFDFVKNSTKSKVKIRQFLFFEDGSQSQENIFEFAESKSKISIPYLDIKFLTKTIGVD